MTVDTNESRSNRKKWFLILLPLVLPACGYWVLLIIGGLPADSPFNDCMPCYSALLIFGLLIWIGFQGNFKERERLTAPWQQLAEENDLHFVPGRLMGPDASVYGTYRGQAVNLDLEKNQTTRLTMEMRGTGQKDVSPLELPTTEAILRVLSLTKLPPSIMGRIRIEAKGRRVSYEFGQVLNEVEKLEAILEQLSQLIEAYRPILAAGGEAVPALRKVMLDHYMGPGKQAVELLRGIGERTAARFQHRAAGLTCPTCLARFAGNKVAIPGEPDVIVYGCRICGQSQAYFEGRVFMVLDQQMSEAQVETKKSLRRNWLARRQLCDFHAVAIIHASDEEVERFAVQVGNDTDPVRRSRYPKIICMLNPDNDLSENTRRILANTFGVVMEAKKNFAATCS